MAPWRLGLSLASPLVLLFIFIVKYYYCVFLWLLGGSLSVLLPRITFV